MRLLDNVDFTRLPDKGGIWWLRTRQKINLTIYDDTNAILTLMTIKLCMP